jgi:hypothetical protein
MTCLIRTFILSAWFASALTLCRGQPTHPSAPQAWTATGTLAADEAFQAAAADEKFVYAITNSQVAKYDRQTKKRVAVSTGEAKHLDSGFQHSGKLYCAHSNYPQTPEQSEIMVLDLEAMKLSTPPHSPHSEYFLLNSG